MESCASSGNVAGTTYTYDSSTYDTNNRVASITTNKVGSFAIITPIKEEVVNKGNLGVTIVLAVVSILVIGAVGYFSIREKRKKNS